MEDLPDELLVSIFIRLFAKQLAQMRSVSKSWNALLSESSFIKSHLHHSIHHNDRILLAFYNGGASSPYSLPFTTHACPPSSHLELTNFIKFPVNPTPSGNAGFRVVGCVNGLMCSSYGDSLLHIWNPSLSAVLTLPPYFMPSCDSNSSIRVYFRFGFDPNTNDYKVVKLMGVREIPSPYGIRRWLDVEVFSMRKGLWESITERFPSDITLVFADEACVGGHIHWFCCTYENSERLVAFDLGSGTFREITFPLPTPDYYDYCKFFGVLGGKLYVMSWVDIKTCEVWVMEEYGVVESWVKRHVFSQSCRDIHQFGFTSHNGFLLYDTGHLLIYDPIANKTEILENFHHREGVPNKIVEFVDSLVWIAPNKHP